MSTTMKHTPVTPAPPAAISPELARSQRAASRANEIIRKLYREAGGKNGGEDDIERARRQRGSE